MDILLEPGAQCPKYATEGSSGADLYACIPAPITLLPGSTNLISTGVRVSVPYGYEAQVRSRSGLALNKGLFVLNSPGTIDSDYRGVVGVILANFSHNSVVIEPGERIAQLVISKVEKFPFQVVGSLDNTARGEGGFGST